VAGVAKNSLSRRLGWSARRSPPGVGLARVSPSDTLPAFTDVGGHHDLPAGGHQRLPVHGQPATQGDDDRTGPAPRAVVRSDARRCRRKSKRRQMARSGPTRPGRHSSSPRLAGHGRRRVRARLPAGSATASPAHCVGSLHEVPRRDYGRSPPCGHRQQIGVVADDQH
jgi:hypothetical protein